MTATTTDTQINMRVINADTGFLVPHGGVILWPLNFELPPGFETVRLLGNVNGHQYIQQSIIPENVEEVDEVVRDTESNPNLLPSVLAKFVRWLDEEEVEEWKTEDSAEEIVNRFMESVKEENNGDD